MNGTPDRAEGTGSAEGTGFGLPEPGAGDEGGSRLADDACSEAGSEGEGQSFATFVAEVGQLKDMVKLMDREENVDARMCAILERYQEQPQLLDTHIESLVTPLAETLRSACRSDDVTESQIRRTCHVLYVLTKVRGFKVVIKFFPHSVADLEPCLDLLDKQNAKDSETWETRYVLLLWLSILVMVPFALNSVDSNTENGGDNLIDRIIDVNKRCLGEAAKTRDAAAYLLARLLTRPDMEDNEGGTAAGAQSAGSAPLVAFLQWCVQQMETDDSLLVTGVQQALAHLFKMGQRNSLLDKVSLVADVLHAEGGATTAGSTTQRLQRAKLAQRLGLTYLPPRVAAWRYHRGHRSLLDNLQAAISAPACAGDTPSTAAAGVRAPLPGAGTGGRGECEDEEDDAFVPVEVEYVIDALLQSLQDRDTVVRWSGAKGLGRVAARLPKHLANEVVGAVMGLFAAEDSSAVNTWHGGCLALAEMARRGVLLPDRLGEVVAIVHKALVLDVRRGATSIGAHVRDAAAYVCWAFARAYAPAEMAAHVPMIAPSLLLAALYDREINCRRAAAAAFQENVGRQGNYPHGIDIVTRADYFALGNRANAFLVVAPYVASFEAYQEPLAAHLVSRQLKHWDSAMRHLAAEALRKLVPLFPAYFVDTALPALLEQAMSSDVPTRHGGACGLAQVLLGMKDCGHALPAALEARVVGLVPAVEKARLFRGRGGEAMRGACCRVSEAVAMCQLPLTPAQITRCIDSVGENLKHPTEAISAAAVAAVYAVSREYFGQMPAAWVGELVKEYLAKLDDLNPAARRGFALALGSLAPRVLGAEEMDQEEPEQELVIDEETGEMSGGGGGGAMRRLEAVIQGLAKAATCLQEDKEERDAEARRNAVRALVTLVQEVGIGGRGGEGSGGWRQLERQHVDMIVVALLQCFGDYSADNRGDVGSWVREAAMLALEQVVPRVLQAEGCAEWLAPERIKSIIDALIQQLCEKIDRIRSCAGHVLVKLLLLEPPLPGVPHRDLLLQVLVDHEQPAVQVDWKSPAAAFPRLVQLVQLPEYTLPAVSGLVMSVGGLAEGTGKHSWGALLSQLQSTSSKDTRLRVASTLTHTLGVFQGVDRVIVPIFKTAHLIVTNGCLDDIEEEEMGIAEALLRSAQVELRGCNDVVKLESGASLVAAILQFPFAAVRVPSLQTLLAFLCHKFPRVRRKAAEELYMQVLTYENIVREEGMEEVMRVLPETDWTQPVAGLKPLRDSLYSAFGVERVAPASTVPKRDRSALNSAEQDHKEGLKALHGL